MKPLLSMAIAGIACLPATYSFTRDGNIAIALLIIVSISAFGSAIAVAMTEDNKAHLAGFSLMFVLGAVVCELVAFMGYYVTYGRQDPDLDVGVAVSLGPVDIMQAR